MGESLEDDSDDDNDDDELNFENLDKEVVKLMKMMDKDLEDSCLGQSFEKRKKKKENNNNNVIDGSEEEEDDEVDVDYNLIKNFLTSVSEQHGLSGPVSTLFEHLNINK
jgi:hypothetical protein